MNRSFPLTLCLLLLPVIPGFCDSEADPFALFKNRQNIDIPNRFTFCRIQYDSYGGYGLSEYVYDGRHWYRWETDYPEADENFLFRLSELTTIDPNPRPIVRRLTDPDIFDFPLIYMSDVGWQELSEKENVALRHYLERGGMLWVDDFWGLAEWQNFEETMKDVMPDVRWQAIPKTHPIMNIVYPLEACPQIPARDFANEGWKWDPPWIHKGSDGYMGAVDVEQVHFRGYFDIGGRLMVVCTHNTDLGDGFEREAEDENYFQTYSTKAYAMGINIVVYALSH